MQNIKQYFILWTSRVILRILSDSEKKLFRKWESSFMKQISNEEHRNFNELCVQNDLFPTYTNIKLHDARAGTQDFVKRFRKDLILRQIKEQQNNIEQLAEQVQLDEQALQAALSSNTKHDACKLLIHRVAERHRTTLQLNYEKKLC